jgi:hypothetical protein
VQPQEDRQLQTTLRENLIVMFLGFIQVLDMFCYTSNTCATVIPTLLRRVLIETTGVHLFVSGSYFSILFKLELPSLPPTAYSKLSSTAKSWVLRRTLIDASDIHVLVVGSYLSIVFKQDAPSFPPEI